MGDTILPGIFESLEITASSQTDEAEVKGKKNKITQAVGFSNAQIRLGIVLTPEDDEDDCTQQIRTIQELFRKSPAQEVPGVYRFINKHAQARNINEVIFSELRTYEDNKSDKFIASLSFIEHVPVNIKIATTSSSSNSDSSGSASNTKKTSTLDQASVKKTDKTPAKDTQEPGFGMKIINWLRGKDIG